MLNLGGVLYLPSPGPLLLLQGLLPPPSLPGALPTPLSLLLHGLLPCLELLQVPLQRSALLLLTACSLLLLLQRQQRQGMIQSPFSCRDNSDLTRSQFSCRANSEPILQKKC